MRIGIAVAFVGLCALSGGCASARYVNQDAEGGTIAIPSNRGAFAEQNRQKATELITKHVGPNYEIVDEHEVVTGQSTMNNQQTNTDFVQNKRNPNSPSERQITTGTTTQQNMTEWHITYRRKASAGSFNGGAPNGLTPAGGVRPQGPPAGVVPNVMPISHFAPRSRPTTPAACST